MSSVKPSRRWQPAFYPFKREKACMRALAKTELLIKGPLFGCRMCGNCLLQKTAMICPMGCPKGMRNGPCGGITPEKKCYVDETRECVWYCIYEKAERSGIGEMLLEVLPPLDWSKTGTETWSEVLRHIKKEGFTKFLHSFFTSDKVKKAEIRDKIFRPIRQPDWWKGDSDYHPALGREPVSDLEKRLRSGEFVITAEMTPPLSSSSDKLVKGIMSLKGSVTAINFTDSSSACPRMSSVACCKVALDNMVEPVLQITARDSTRTRLQSDIVGINQIGIRNVLCITGDSPKLGPSPVNSMNIFDLDSVQMLWILRRMRDEGIYLDGRTMKHPPVFFLGAGTSPFSAEPVLQAIKDHKKVNAGAQFFQTNLIFEPSRLDPWLEELDKRNVLEKVFILTGIVPLKSYKAAEWLHNKVPGVTVPEKILTRMQKAGDNAPEEGIRIALELIEEIKGKKGINGIHLVTLGQEEAGRYIIKNIRHEIKS